MSPTNRKRTDGQNEKGQSKPPDSRKQYPEPEPDPEPFPQAAGDIATSTRLNIADGIVVISGDWHCYVSEWSRKPPTAYRALLKFLKGDIDLAHPIKATVVNGDFLNAAQIHRHPRCGWEDHGGTLRNEIELTQEMMGNVEMICGRSIQRRANIGNHDVRVMSFLSNKIPEWEGMPYTTLNEFFPSWDFAWGCEINDNILVKHKWAGGQYAPAQNALRSGKTCVTGHLHRGAVFPVRDAMGLRWGVDHGAVADVRSGAFRNYTESTASYTWTSGFAVITILKDKRVLMPELLLVVDEDRGLVSWRGQLLKA